MRSAALLAAAVLLLPAPLLAQVYTRINANGVVEATNAPASPSFRLTYPGKGTLIHSRSFRPSRYSGQFDPHVEEACRLQQVSPDLVRAVIAVESEFDQWAVSSKGARGLMQLMPATMRRFGVSDAFDARANILAGTRYLRLLLDQFAGDVELALAAYNAGENAVARYGGVPPFKETRGYVAKIQALLGGFALAPTTAVAGAASFFTPSLGLRPPQASPRPAPRPGRLEPARPRTYYRWRDPQGATHVAEAPPAEGTVYQTVRALD
ncbi:MAG TPA: lytic transglycosylase domain-containing protein [Vicinamibacteria bacterium]|nr:lytic transglycosylase domain-containing protein [Vicinamibacteria bacterium]